MIVSGSKISLITNRYKNSSGLHRKRLRHLLGIFFVIVFSSSIHYHTLFHAQLFWQNIVHVFCWHAYRLCQLFIVTRRSANMILCTFSFICGLVILEGHPLHDSSIVCVWLMILNSFARNPIRSNVSSLQRNVSRIQSDVPI